MCLCVRVRAQNRRQTLSESVCLRFRFRQMSIFSRSEFRTNASWTNWAGQTWQRLFAQIYLDRDTIEEYGQRVPDLQAEHRSLNDNEALQEVDANAADQSRL